MARTAAGDGRRAAFVGAALAGYPCLHRIRQAERVLPLAGRVVAAWVAAIALLLLALAVRTARA
ncbi:hypothetical protein [Ramlibacter sp.]|uniref:hypothetical protein n=1 Tax=Ramlibacter sp. TaxID=1917967 RepID=UPI00261652D0|nr:hypothetical protein [Ramlibacter sp.]